jgi:UDP-2-acetamido-2-deoxy-ribo-hexuluronate aminotransferase
MVEKLTAQEIPTAVHYPVPLHLQEAFADLGYKEGDFPVSEEVSTQIMSLPMSPYLTEAQQDFIVNAIKG